ncbi:NAD-dependent epimerase/dehydratase [Cellulomonas flavigena DSM 20109]|uniref:NAD-dependent epimerase/dehydratase n=1 Tax=Cellulomonas flavigena (strain ATCC 482 / DSM 20109 / BCRC 11376 / JCM 18109 / NBRC 3775 / NCIMB 8073 / NRS 134) TaxID=446466 RepID=D5UJE8_CELFN|nr:NAD-dependent epimerase/dehydratase family protein [Cellulomonas flavigena]ADG73671.1 NAD-dependent epimerase/dehydratase [Cellulomonas flavigena DSM 20109]
MRVVLTGAHGFLGWHTRVLLSALGHEVDAVGRDGWATLPAALQRADGVIHIAGVNRGPDDEVEQGNIRLATTLAEALRSTAKPVPVVYANSVQADNGTPYGRGKAEAARILTAATSERGAVLRDVLLPNLFGEHGRPGYNSFVATFVDHVLHGRAPEVVDREIELLHVQAAARVLVDEFTADTAGQVHPAGTATSVSFVLETLQQLEAVYRNGDMPDLTTPLVRDLFNTLRAASFPERAPIPLSPRTDDRGSLVEVVRSHGGQGQAFTSTTKPGITRGEHFHLRKVERFVVINGCARISLRRVFHSDVVSFDVNGDEPVAIDMPIGWAHNITNIGDSELTTLFWTNELFDPASPDTWPETVGQP